MGIQKTEKTVLNEKDILEYIAKYETTDVPVYEKLWSYYIAENQAILKRKEADQNSPSNKIPVGYGRKLVTTFTGYAYRPRYITYKPNIKEEMFQKETIDGIEQDKLDPAGNKIKIITKEDLFMNSLQDNFNLNQEHIKTSRHGRNTAIYGVSYELCYIDGQLTSDPNIPFKAVPKFFVVDPKEIILLYDYSSEPKKAVAIRYYKVDGNKYKVEVYYKNSIELYTRVLDDSGDWRLIDKKGPYANYFGDIPVIPYYLGDEMLGIIKPVLALIDANDVLFSDSMNEFDRFAYAYLVMKRFGITDPTKKKDPESVSLTLKFLKRFRIFEHLDKDAEIKFLTKDIPDEFISFMSSKIKEEIHIQSHVPDFDSMKTGELTGAAIDRLLFDFENLVSSAEADFDIGLLERIRLLSIILDKSGAYKGGTADMIMISHKRNRPLNLSEYAETANTMKQAGFSRYLIADIMPDDIVPNVEVELARQDKDAEAMLPDIDDLLGLGEDEETTEKPESKKDGKVLENKSNENLKE